MRFGSPLLAFFLAVGCGMPSDSFPVSEFEVGCAGLRPQKVFQSFRTVATEHDLAVDVKEASPAYARLQMDEVGTGNKMFVEYWASGEVPAASNCSKRGLPCVGVIAFTPGQIPDDELTAEANSQRKSAGRLKALLESTCKV